MMPMYLEALFWMTAPLLKIFVPFLKRGCRVATFRGESESEGALGVTDLKHEGAAMPTDDLVKEMSEDKELYF